MAVEQWNDFTYYNVGDEVQNGSSTKFACILRNINQPPPNLTYWNNLTPVATGIASLQALTEANNGGNLVLTSTNDSINFNVNAPTGAIDLAVNFPTALVVDSLNNLTGALTLLDGGNCSITPNGSNGTITLTVPSLVSSLNGLQNILSLVDGGNVTITPNVGAGTITLSVPSIPISVASLNGCQNVVSLTNGGNVTITPNVGAGTISLSVPSIPSSVTSLNGCQNVVSLTNGGNVTITPNVGAGTISLSVPSIPSSVTSLNGLTNAVNLTSPNGSITFNVSGQNIQLQSATQPVYQATYYKSVQQNLVNANTDITFDVVATWSNANGYITHTNGTTDFTVAVAGLYQLEFNISINANGATWNTALNKAVSIDITRPTIAEQAVIQNNALVANNTSYQQAVASSFYLNVGDVINLRSTLAFASATPFAVGIQNTFDLNTFFTWRYISA